MDIKIKIKKQLIYNYDKGKIGFIDIFQLEKWLEDSILLIKTLKSGEI